MKSILNESEDVMNSLYLIATAVFVLAAFSFFCLIAILLGEDKNTLVTEIINILFIHFIFLGVWCYDFSSPWYSYLLFYIRGHVFFGNN